MFTYVSDTHFLYAINQLIEIIDDEILSSEHLTHRFTPRLYDVRSWLCGQRSRALGRDEFITHCRSATEADYTQWLTGYRARGGQITHTYPGMWKNCTDSWFVLTDVPDTFPSLYGAHLVNVIVPANLQLKPADIPSTYHGYCGHSNFYFMSGFTVNGGWVSRYV